MAREGRSRWTWTPSRIRTVIDRLDRLADGRVLVLDYKTGKNLDARNWSAARLSEPGALLRRHRRTAHRGADVADAAFAGSAATFPASSASRRKRPCCRGSRVSTIPAASSFPPTPSPTGRRSSLTGTRRCAPSPPKSAPARRRFASPTPGPGTLRRPAAASPGGWAATLPDPLLPDTLAP